MNRFLTLFFLLCISCLGTKAQNFDGFFRNNGGEAYEIILRAAHPSSTFKSGFFIRSGSTIYVTIKSKGLVFDNMESKFKLIYDSDNYSFTSIQCVSDDDPYPAFRFVEKIRNLGYDLIKDTSIGQELAGIFGETRKYSAQDWCCAILTYLWWKY